MSKLKLTGFPARVFTGPVSERGVYMRRLRPFLLGFLLIFGFARPALSQYMYLDVDGDGVNTTADRLNDSDSTVITIYLDSNHDRDGSAQSCNSHTASTCGASQTTEELTVFGYTVVLHAGGGTVQWGTFQPDSASFTQLQPQVQDSTDVEFVFLRPAGTSSPAGLSSLGKISVTITGGSPNVQIARSTAMDPFGFGTGFGTTCSGSAYSHTYVLGDPADSCGTTSGAPGDWFDTDGVGEPEGLITGPGPGGGGPDSPEQNYPPIFNPPGGTVSAVGGSAFRYDFSVTTSDGEPITLAADLSRLPSGNNATFATDTDTEPSGVLYLGHLRWTPTYADSGTYRVIFTATASATTRDTIYIAVAKGYANLHIQMPGPGYRVEYSQCLDSTDAYCTTTFFFTYSDASGQVVLPLYYTSPNGIKTYYDKVQLRFPAYTTSVFVATSLSADKILYPGSVPTDRMANYTVPADPWIVQTFAIFAQLQPWYQTTFGISRGSLRLRLFGPDDGIGAEYGGTEGDFIHWPNYPSYFVNNQPVPWVAAHEYTHAIQYVVYGMTGTCTWDTGDCLVDNIFGSYFCYSCATHYRCGAPLSKKGAWNEGMANAVGEMFYRAKYNPYGYQDESVYCSPTGPDEEGSIESFLFSVASRAPMAFMNTFRNATMTYTGQAVGKAVTVEIYQALWNDVPPSPGQIVDHEPGTWNTDILYRHFILGGTSGVEDQQASGVPSVVPFPNPISSRLGIEVRNVREGAHFQLFDVTGRLVQSKDLPTIQGGSITTYMPVQKLPSGIYLFRAISASGAELAPPRKLVLLR